jgi:hypothetical protein
MNRPPNPITQGFRAASHDLAIVLLEILWRWSFAMVAVLLVFLAGIVLLGPLHVADSFLAALRSQNTSKMGIIVLSVVLTLGTKLWIAFMVVPVVLAIIWSLLAAAVRRITVRRLGFTQEPLGFGSMLAVQWLRALNTLIALFLLIAALVWAFHTATSGRFDLFRFYSICVPAIVLIGLVWLALNWRLSQTALFGRKRQGLGAALRQSRLTVRRHRSDFAGIAFIFFLLRLVLLMIAVSIIGLTSSMMARTPESYFALMAVVVLAYCVVADFFYVARTAAYMALAAMPDPIAAEMGIIDPELPVEKSSL